MVAPSPASARSSAPGTPSLNPFSPAFSMSAPYSVQFDASYESDDDYLKRPSHRAPSQFRLLKMNAPKWGKALSGCIGAIGSAYTIVDAGSMTKDISRGSNAVGSVFAILDKNTEIDPDTSWGRDSIKETIWGAKEFEIRKAAMLANAREFISGMKDGYDTYCGERGVQLSGGQKQRIALARAMLKNPSILLLDEATSALDTVSESLVQEALEKMMNGRACIVVAHRLTTIHKSDSIAVIQDGKVAEQGSHSDLLSVRGGAYSNLVKIQGSN
ncbi:hypothetical protein L6452_28711 [Arctium lappa]|uniref:Uncharacterized protein n=1 Tax=Arctium lappa TaxID=4217 RepID=A0ACB8ZZF2_ARCLA|nr:hypothetical protein L6452_28711 [Arctium lappa]